MDGQGHHCSPSKRVCMTRMAAPSRVRWMLVILAGLMPVLVIVQSASALCLAQTETQAFRRAQVVFEGVMPSGPTIEAGDLGAALRSNARMRVERYRKGDGPRMVRIPTAGSAHDGAGRLVDGQTGPAPAPVLFTEDGITPKAGERWVIYGDLLPDGSVRTSICAGSHRVGEHGLFAEPGVVDVIRDEQLGWVAAVVLAAAAALFVRHRSTRAEGRGRP